MFAITMETYSAGCEGRRTLNIEFKTEKKALRYLKGKFGKLEEFKHQWSDSEGVWVAPIKQGVPRKYFCIWDASKSE